MIRFLPVLLLTASAVAATTPQASAGTVTASRVCHSSDAVTLAGKTTPALGFQRLDQLPPASEYLTVYRRVGDCPAPVIVRYDIGQRPAPRR